MEIKNDVTYSVDVAQKAQEQGQRAANDKNAVGTDAAAGEDSVKLSSGYREMTQVKRMDEEGGGIRTDRVEELRSLIEAGAYHVKPELIANSMLNERFLSRK